MPDTIDPRYTDLRTVQRYITRGLVDEKAWEKHLKALPDLADKAQTVETTMIESDADGVED